MSINELNEILRHASNEEPWHSECGYIYEPRNDHEGDDGPFRCVGEVAEADAEAIVAIHNHASALLECARLLRYCAPLINDVKLNLEVGSALRQIGYPEKT